MKEKDFQADFGKLNRINGVFELKICKGTSLPFDALADHQEEGLVEASIGDGVYHKLSDIGGSSGTGKKPFDCFRLQGINAFVVVQFYEFRKKKNVYYIRIQDWIHMRKYAGRKSMTESMAIDEAVIKENYIGRL